MSESSNTNEAPPATDGGEALAGKTGGGAYGAEVSDGGTEGVIGTDPNDKPSAAAQTRARVTRVTLDYDDGRTEVISQRR